jgi:hypothetical protein
MDSSALQWLKAVHPVIYDPIMADGCSIGSQYHYGDWKISIVRTFFNPPQWRAFINSHDTCYWIGEFGTLSYAESKTRERFYELYSEWHKKEEMDETV